MDPDISRWVSDFLLRRSVSDSLVAKTLPDLSLSGADPRLKKTVLLRALQSSHSNASITENALEAMEAIEEIDLNDAVPITDSMRRAYCAVAVECTVKFLAACPDDAAGKYLDAVRRIWRGRVGRMESAGLPEGLFSEELARWRDDLEAAVSDARVCERLAGLNSRTDALNELKVYLNEAWGILGPSFLDSMAVKAKGESVRNRNGGFEVSANVDGNDDDAIDNDGDASNHDNDGDASNHDNDGDASNHDNDGDASNHDNDGDASNHDNDGDASNHDNDGDASNHDNDGDASNHDNDGDASNHDIDGYDDGGCRLEDKNPDKEDDLEERVGAYVDLNHDLAAERDTEIEKGNLQRKRKHLAHTCPDTSIGEFAYCGELKRKCGEGLKGLTKHRRDFAGDDRSEPDDGGEKHGNQVLGGCDSPAQREKEIQKAHLKHRLKHTVLHKCHKGVKLSGTEEVEPAKSCRTCDSVPSAEVKKVRESLKSSSLELKALVKDPLPDALQTSEVVRSKLAVKGINQNGDVDVDVPDPIVCNSSVPIQPNDANCVKQSFVHCSNNVRRPNLLERKATARTDQLDDSLDNSPRVVQPRKKNRRWTSLEEDTLRDGVKMFGEGSWQAIRSYYSNIFENRSGVDLKDKWRNMMR